MSRGFRPSTPISATNFYRVFTEFLPSCTEGYRVLPGLVRVPAGITHDIGLYLVLLGFLGWTELDRVVPGFTGFLPGFVRMLTHLIEFYLVFTGFHLVFLVFIRPHLVLAGVLRILQVDIRF